MEKMSKLDYLQVKTSLVNNNANEVTFTLSPLERGFGNTLAVSLRRILLSNITSLALFAIKINGVDHEFRTVPGIVEDVTQLIMNLRKVKFQYNPEFIRDDEIIRVSLNSDTPGTITSRHLEFDNPNIEIVNKTLEIATLNPKSNISLEMFLRPGRGFVSNEENKKFILDPQVSSKMESKIQKGLFIATDSNFGPVENVKYEIFDMNTSSPKIQEKLEFTIRTDGTVSPKDALKQASEILIAHFQIIGDVENMKLNVFEEEKIQKEETTENDIDINQLGLSVRSLNALKKINKTKISQIAAMTLEELEQTKNLGKKSLDEIQEVLKNNGYSLSKGDE
ncbi:DNA-directed RNA polymerase alpha chain [Mycoplasmopsis maculosa]|uniref:DNA-directed RNA polymerase subunit alpha n=1 Tax=Mycoplasmopsis maculosa TaxID=114885 RepID=A0A449B3L5_9BACT|nr:DNA-directed RNA polymerase subunit alpha [Mycoplasmopsis maculosa]VEU75138.1 DNA-directed RNA polymerase alpha chain [Mycoplasmopsis maculosa]